MRAALVVVECYLADNTARKRSKSKRFEAGKVCPGYGTFESLSVTRYCDSTGVLGVGRLGVNNRGK